MMMLLRMEVRKIKMTMSHDERIEKGDGDDGDGDDGKVDLMAMMMIMMNDGYGDDVDGYVEHARGGESGSDRSVEEGRGANQL